MLITITIKCKKCGNTIWTGKIAPIPQTIEHEIGISSCSMCGKKELLQDLGLQELQEEIDLLNPIDESDISSDEE